METLERRDLLTTIAWSAGPDLPDTRTDAVALVAPNNSVYLLGGDATQATATPRLAANGSSWTTGHDIDTQRDDLGAVNVGSKIYLFGGAGNNEGSDESLDYDYGSGDSQDLAKMNQIRYDLGYASDAVGRVYAIGGIGVYDDGEVWSQAERYNPSTDAWSPIASLPVALHGLSAIGDGNGSIFVFGGSTTLSDSGIQGASYKYDIASDSWSTIAPMPVATRDSAVVIDPTGAIFVLGGMSPAGATDAVQVYDPATNGWTAETPLPQPVYSHAATYAASERIVVAGGFDEAGSATRAVYRTQRLDIADIAPAITTTPVVSASLDRPYTYDVDATGNPAPAYSLVTAPAGMTVDSATGVISWQPVAGQLGVNSVTVHASNRAGTVEQSFDVAVVADTIAPTTPGDFAFVDATETSVTLSWTASTDAGGVDHYEVSTARYTGPRFGKRWVYTVVDTVTTTTSTVSGLTPLNSQTYSVQAFDAAGNPSARSPRIVATTLAAPTLTFQVGTQTTGTVVSPALHPLEFQLRSTANPTATFSKVAGPDTMTVDATTGLVQWTPTVDDIGLHTFTFSAANSVGVTELDITFDVVSDAPQLSVAYNPTTGGERFALAGALFTAQINDASQSTSTYELIAAPANMSIDAATGAIAWTPVGTQGGTNSVTVRATNAGGTADLTFAVDTLFTSAATGATVTGETLLNPTLSWAAPTGEGADLVDSYQIFGSATWGVGRTKQTHRVNYSVPASETSVLMTGLVASKAYTIYIVPVDAAGNAGLQDAGTPVSSTPALPQVSWSVNGFTGGLSVPGPVIAEQPVEIVLTDQRADPSTMTLVDGPAGLTFDPLTNTGSWIPTAAQVTSGYSATIATFEATNSIGSVSVSVPMRVFFSGTVHNAVTTRFGDTATASWDPPTDNVAPIAAYSITRSWTWSGRPRSITWTVGGDVTSISFGLVPTGAVSHKGITITPVDENGNFGVSTKRILYGQRQNDLPPIAVDDSYAATEDTPLTVDHLAGVRANDIDTDNTPLINPLTVQLLNGPANGTVTLDAAGSFIYTPNVDFNGTDTFTYRAYDGKFYSDNALVTIDVAPVNDGPAALDDYYTVDQDAILVIDAAGGVLANDSDIDGDALAVSVVSNPDNGTISLSADGSFSYTPNAEFLGVDTFTYIASDSLADSRIANVNIEVIAPKTKFFVVDTDVEQTFEYDADGRLVEHYALRSGNKGSQGATASSDGATVWVINGNKRVFVYDDSGQFLGRWNADGPRRVDGIATDDSDIWILDRKLDTVFHYAGAAAARTGSLVATDSFPLHANNRNGRGITTDGESIWIVNASGGKDKVYKYTVGGDYVGRWNIDPENSNPTGITIDPTGASDAIWIVDNVTDSVYQYNGATTRVSGSDLADAMFPLAPTNTNPQGIADPPASIRSERATRASTEQVWHAAPWSRSEASNVSASGSVAETSQVDAWPTVNNSRHDAFSEDGHWDRDEELVADLAAAIAGTRPSIDNVVAEATTTEWLRNQFRAPKSDGLTDWLANISIEAIFSSPRES